MSEITLSRAVRSNLLNLQSSADLLARAQDRLSTGLRVNSALDNPTNFFTAQNLTSRAGDLSQLLDSVSTAIQTVNAAGKGITGISKLVESAQATARQALQTSATISQTTTVTPVVEHFATVTSGAFAAPPSISTLTINGIDVTIHDWDDIDLALMHITDANITGVSAAEGTGLDAGKIVLTGATGVDIDVTTAIAGFTGTESDTYIAPVTGGTSTTTVPNPKRAELVASYNDILDQIDALAKDSGFNGVNLLKGDSLSVLFNEDGSSKLDIVGENDDSTTLGLAALTSTGFDNNASIYNTLDDLKLAIDDLRSHAVQLGSSLSIVQARREFTTHMIDVLNKGASNLTLADSNNEAADVLALQTRQQLSSTALSLASQADQNVLRLF
jgi:flagellin